MGLLLCKYKESCPEGSTLSVSSFLGDGEHFQWRQSFRRAGAFLSSKPRVLFPRVVRESHFFRRDQINRIKLRQGAVVGSLKLMHLLQHGIEKRWKMLRWSGMRLSRTRAPVKSATHMPTLRWNRACSLWSLFESGEQRRHHLHPL